MLPAGPEVGEIVNAGSIVNVTEFVLVTGVLSDSVTE